MADEAAGPRAVPGRSRPRLFGRVWRRVREPIARSTVIKSSLASMAVWALRLVRATNPLVAGSDDLDAAVEGQEPVIFASWHGQHLLAPCYYTRARPLAGMASRSADAELNAIVFEKQGFTAVRGSGGRRGDHRPDKGGARALIELKRHLDAGSNVVMIADIVHAKARESGLGIVMLAKVSGRPILPVAAVGSRRKVFEKSWDRTTVTLPFGRAALTFGAPIFVPRDASDELLEEKRREVTRTLNEAHERAYRLADGDSR